jgi:hypothetical protein
MRHERSTDRGNAANKPTAEDLGRARQWIEAMLSHNEVIRDLRSQLTRAKSPKSVRRCIRRLLEQHQNALTGQPDPLGEREMMNVAILIAADASIDLEEARRRFHIIKSLPSAEAIIDNAAEHEWLRSYLGEAICKPGIWLLFHLGRIEASTYARFDQIKNENAAKSHRPKTPRKDRGKGGS